MFWKLSKNSSVKNILVITLSNIGDVLLSAPVIDILLRDFSSARLSLVIGERAASLFEGNTRISQIHIFDKERNFFKQAQWTLALREFRYDLVVDLRNSMIGYSLTPHWVTSPQLFINKQIHLKDRHLNRLRMLYDFGSSLAVPSTIAPSVKDQEYIDQLLKPFLMQDSSLPAGRQAFVFIAPFAADSSKTWDSMEFAHLSKAIFNQYGRKVVMIGNTQQKQAIEDIVKQADVPILNLAGRTNLIQAAALIKRSLIAVVHDSGPMHIASYLNKPVVALFGPTDPRCSSPWSSISRVVHRNYHCPRCLNPKALNLSHHCMSSITQRDVLDAFGEVYAQIK